MISHGSSAAPRVLYPTGSDLQTVAGSLVLDAKAWLPVSFFFSL